MHQSHVVVVNNMISYSTIGDSLHVANLANIALYAGLLYNYGNGAGGVFDEEWLKAGFCLPHGDEHYRTTHDLSGYVMVAIALMGIALQKYLSSKAKDGRLQKADSLAFWALVGALGHASGHFIIANAIRMDFYPPPDERFIDDLVKSSSIAEGIMKAGPGYPLFWMPLVKTYMMNTAKNRVAGLAFIINIGALFVPVKFGFSYTQAVLFAGMSIDQLMIRKKDKGFEYALWPLITTIPNGVFSWVESVTCTSSFLMREHGHLVYDIYMASSYIVFYLICWARLKYTVKSKVA